MLALDSSKGGGVFVSIVAYRLSVCLAPLPPSNPLTQPLLDTVCSVDDLFALLRARGEPLEMAEEEQAAGDPVLGLDGDRFRPTDVIAAILATSAKSSR